MWGGYEMIPRQRPSAILIYAQVNTSFHGRRPPNGSAIYTHGLFEGGGMV